MAIIASTGYIIRRIYNIGKDGTIEFSCPTIGCKNHRLNPVGIATQNRREFFLCCLSCKTQHHIKIGRRNPAFSKRTIVDKKPARILLEERLVSCFWIDSSKGGIGLEIRPSTRENFTVGQKILVQYPLGGIDGFTTTLKVCYVGKDRLGLKYLDKKIFSPKEWTTAWANRITRK